MQVQILSVNVEDKGKYKIADTAYKDANGKVAGKKIFSFGAAEAAFKVLTSGDVSGKTFTVTQVKNDKGYLDWTALTPGTGAAPAASGSAQVAGVAATVRSNYETPEERAQRQVLIVRQSSLTNAIATLSVGAKAVKPAEVVALAQEFVDFVFDNAVKAKEKVAATGTGFDDMDDDAPF